MINTSCSIVRGKLSTSETDTMHLLELFGLV